MTIHPENPFTEPESQRDPARRLRGRLGGAVTLWTTGDEASRTGLTVSSVLVAPGDPAHLLGLVDPDSDLVPAVSQSGTAVVQVLAWGHRDLADAFAGVTPAPGGPFRMAAWDVTDWGPVLRGVSAWAGIRVGQQGVEVGWSVLLDGVIEHVEIADGADGDPTPLVHRRGRYLRPPQQESR